MTPDELPEPLEARLRAILARSPADWQLGKVMPGQEPGSWIVELLDGSGRLMATVIVAEQASKQHA